MIDKTPYIIVDNRKIAPIQQSPRTKSAADDESSRRQQPFGVVDRVTISKEAQEMFLKLQTQTGATDDLPAIAQRANGISTAAARLTYSPEKIR